MLKLWMQPSRLKQVIAWIFILSFGLTGIPYFLHLCYTMASNSEITRTTNILDQEILKLKLPARAEVRNKPRTQQNSDTIEQVRILLAKVIGDLIKQRHLQSMASVLSQKRTVLLCTFDPAQLPRSLVDPTVLTERTNQVRNSIKGASMFGVVLQVIKVADRESGEVVCASTLADDVQTICTVEYCLEPDAPRFAYFRSNDPEQKFTTTILEYAQTSMSPEVVTVDDQTYVLYPVAQIDLNAGTEDAERCIRMVALSKLLKKYAKTRAKQIQPTLSIQMKEVDAIELSFADPSFNPELRRKVFACAVGEGGVIEHDGQYVAFRVTSIKNDPDATPTPSMHKYVVAQLIRNIETTGSNKIDAD
jgi:hypothetical protein